MYCDYLTDEEQYLLDALAMLHKSAPISLKQIHYSNKIIVMGAKDKRVYENAVHKKFGYGFYAIDYHDMPILTFRGIRILAGDIGDERFVYRELSPSEKDTLKVDSKDLRKLHDLTVDEFKQLMKEILMSK